MLRDAVKQGSRRRGDDGLEGFVPRRLTELCARRAVQDECRQDPVCQPSRDLLWNLGMGRIPILRLRFDGQRYGGLVSSPNVLQFANIDHGDKIQAALRRLLGMSAEEIPVIFQRKKRQTTDRDVHACKETRRKALSVPLAGARSGVRGVPAWPERAGWTPVTFDISSCLDGAKEVH